MIKSCKSKATSSVDQQVTKKSRQDTSRIDSPDIKDRISAWTETKETDAELATVNSVFGARNAWFVRAQYIPLYEEILSDDRSSKEIIQGTAGIGKSSFLLYVLARLRLTGKCALLHFHPDITVPSTAVFFPQNGGTPIIMGSTQGGYYHQFVKWREHVDEDRSLLFVDGNVTFERSNEQNVTYVVANAPSGVLSFMEKGKFRHDHWITTWQDAELVSYGTTVNIEGIEKIVADNMLRIGGIARYAFVKGGAQVAINYALAKTDARMLMKLVTTGIQANGENRKVVDRLLHYHDPNTERPGCKPFSFASAYVASRVAHVLCLEEAFTTAQLLAKFQGIGPASNFRGVLFGAYAARKLSEGGSFVAKKIGGTVEEVLDIAKTEIYQKPTNVLDETNYPPNDIKDKVLWPSPEYNPPAIDMLMFLSTLESCLGFQMTVAKGHTLSLKGMEAALRYFDSVCRELTKKKPPSQYRFCFAVPPDIYLHFSKQDKEFVDKAGRVVRDTKTKYRVEQWILKVE